jgi:hypothetical protein
MREIALATLPGGGQPLPGPAYAEILDALPRSVADTGFDPAFITALVERSAVHRDDGTVLLRPGRAAVVQLLSAVDELDLSAAYRRAAVPLLIVNATAEQQPPPGAPSWVASAQRRQRAAARESGRAAMHENPLVDYVEVQATHGLLSEIPGSVASLIRSFVAKLS